MIVQLNPLRFAMTIKLNNVRCKNNKRSSIYFITWSTLPRALYCLINLLLLHLTRYYYIINYVRVIKDIIDCECLIVDLYLFYEYTYLLHLLISSRV